MNMELTIAGKTHSEILLMRNQKRHLWYKTILLEEKEEVMRILEIVRRDKISASKMGEKNPNFGKLCSQHSERMMGENNPNYGESLSEKTKTKIRGWWTLERRAKQSVVITEKWRDPEYRDWQCVINTGKNNSRWQDGTSFEPYCLMFNERRKKTIRNKYLNRCVVCGKSTLWNKQHLAVHHIDLNKQQGCEGIAWKLVPMCASCHSKIHRNRQYEFIINLLLIKNKGGEINFGEMENNER